MNFNTSIDLCNPHYKENVEQLITQQNSYLLPFYVYSSKSLTTVDQFFFTEVCISCWWEFKMHSSFVALCKDAHILHRAPLLGIYSREIKTSIPMKWLLQHYKLLSQTRKNVLFSKKRDINKCWWFHRMKCNSEIKRIWTKFKEVLYFLTWSSTVVVNVSWGNFKTFFSDSTKLFLWWY